jgi:hypothetical protein
MAGLDGAWPAVGALASPQPFQATFRDDWRDAEPGKLPHKLRRGELAHRGLIPHTPYYGTHDAPPSAGATSSGTEMATGSRVRDPELTRLLQPELEGLG